MKKGDPGKYSKSNDVVLEIDLLLFVFAVPFLFLVVASIEVFIQSEAIKELIEELFVFVAEFVHDLFEVLKEI